MKTTVNIYKHYPLGEGGAKVEQIQATLVDLPFSLKGFAFKEYKYWYVREFTTGLEVGYGYSKTLKNAIKKASEQITRYGKETVLKVLEGKTKINGCEPDKEIKPYTNDQGTTMGTSY